MTNNSETPAPLRPQIRTPRSAAVAGIVFAGLLGISMVLVQTAIPESGIYDPGWIVDGGTPIAVAITLVPFAGIAFLWFMGVLRTQFGDLEDRFFATVFLGSGLLFLASLFLWVGLLSATVVAAADVPGWPDGDAFPLAATLIKVMGSSIMLRMAGVFVFSTSTIWLRAKLMPRWVAFLSMALALIMLIGGGGIRPLRLIFPVWVLVVSILILVAVRRRSDDGEHGP